MYSTSSAERVQNFVNGFSKHGTHNIKLKDLLGLRLQENINRNIITSFPPIGIGSVTLVDQIVLLCLDELLQPESILEIGTFQGFTTKLFAMNSMAKTIYSVDLPFKEVSNIVNPQLDTLLTDGDYNDDYLRDVQNQSGELYLAGLEPDKINLIQLIKQDSTNINFSDVFGNIDLCFIDGGHHYDIVKSDTENALTVMRKGVIVWHDFSSTIHSDVTRYLSERAKHNCIFHVTGSLCAFQFIGF
jgi:predicted O-methyltransferase YrrM